MLPLLEAHSLFLKNREVREIIQICFKKSWDFENSTYCFKKNVTHPRSQPFRKSKVPAPPTWFRLIPIFAINRLWWKMIFELTSSNWKWCKCNFYCYLKNQQVTEIKQHKNFLTHYNLKKKLWKIYFSFLNLNCLS